MPRLVQPRVASMGAIRITKRGGPGADGVEPVYMAIASSKEETANMNADVLLLNVSFLWPEARIRYLDLNKATNEM